MTQRSKNAIATLLLAVVTAVIIYLFRDSLVKAAGALGLFLTLFLVSLPPLWVAIWAAYSLGQRHGQEQQTLKGKGESEKDMNQQQATS